MICTIIWVVTNFRQLFIIRPHLDFLTKEANKYSRVDSEYNIPVESALEELKIREFRKDRKW